MKTLDEVIKAFDNWMPDCDSCVFYCDIYGENNCTIADALHYLREYRDKHDEMLKTEEALGYCEMAENRPLTWEELRTMEGKPIWVEEKYSIDNKWHGRWEVIHSVWGCEWIEDDDPYLFMSDEEYRHKDDMGERWQAYRKERK